MPVFDLNKPSVFFRQAIDDFEICLNTPTVYEIRMWSWHTPLDDGKCAVCLAGAMMAQTFKLSPHERVNWNGDFSIDEQKMFEAIDALRYGLIESVFDILDIDILDIVKPSTLPNCVDRTEAELLLGIDNSRIVFWRRIVKILEEAGY